MQSQLCNLSKGCRIKSSSCNSMGILAARGLAIVLVKKLILMVLHAASHAVLSRAAVYLFSCVIIMLVMQPHVCICNALALGKPNRLFQSKRLLELLHNSW